MTQLRTPVRKALTPNAEAAVYRDQLLTDFSIAHDQDMTDTLASTVFPVVPVELQSAPYMVWPVGAFLRDEMRPRGLGKEPELASGYTLSKDSYYCEEWALADTLDDRQRANSPSSLRLEENIVRKLTNAGIIRRERDWVENFYKPGVWTHDLTGVTTGADDVTTILQLDQAAANPIKVFRKLIRRFSFATGRKPNVAVIGVDVFDTLADDPEFLERTKYTSNAMPGGEDATRQIIANILGVPRIVVPENVYDVRAEGQEGHQLEYIAPTKDIGLFYAAPNAGLNTATAGVRFAWTGLIADEPDVAGEGFGGAIDRARLPTSYSDWFAIRMAFDQKATAKDLGMFIEDAVS